MPADPDKSRDGPITSITPEERRSGFFGTIRRVFRWSVWTAIFAVVLGCLFILYPVDRRIFRAALTQPLVIFTKSGDTLGMVSCICNPTLRHAEIPETIANALIATEDRRFRFHFGVDPFSFGKALFSAGDRGGSTLEMQLAKNTLNGSEPSLFRKFSELFFATRISLAYSKDDILRLYLSRVNFGRLNGVPIYGLRDAAWAWFDKAPESLSLAEGAILVAMINAPSLYNPLRNPEGVAERARLVVARMKTEDLLAQDTVVDVAAAMPTKVRRLPTRDRFLEDQVMRELQDLASALPDGRHYALTTIDPIAQDQARRIVGRDMARFKSRGVARAALLTLDDKGRILAMFGGPDYRRSNWNLAIQARRQPASTAKIATYLAALQDGWTADSQLWDDPARIRSDFKPRNVDGTYKGEIPLQQCLRESRNVCTTWLAEQVGIDTVAGMARWLGIADDQTPNAATVLGAGETTVPAVAAAYLAVSNGGLRYRPHLLRAVLGQNGKVLYRESDEGEQVISQAIASRMKALLGEVTSPGGTGEAAEFTGGFAYGKTGTSQENRDAWFVGFTGQGIATAVWVGPAEGKLMNNVAGGQLPAEIFSDFNVNLVERFQGYVGRLPQGEDSFWRDVNVP